MVVNPDDVVEYIKLESELIFRPEEGIEVIRKSTPEATEIKLLNNKTIKLLGLKDIPNEG